MLTAVSDIASNPHQTDNAKRPSFSAVRDLVRNHVPRHSSSTQHRTSTARVPASAVDPGVNRIEAATDHQSSITRSKQQLSNATGAQLQVATDRTDPKTLPASEATSHAAKGNGLDAIIDEFKKTDRSLPVRHRRDEDYDTGRPYFMLVTSKAGSIADIEACLRGKEFEDDAAMQSFLGREFERSAAAVRRLLLELPLKGSVGKTLAHRREAIDLLPFIEAGEGSKFFDALHAEVAAERVGGIGAFSKIGKGVGWEGL